MTDEELTAYRAEVTRIMAERDRARDIAAALEADLAEAELQTDTRLFGGRPPRVIAPEADRTLDALLGFEVRT